MTAIKVTVPQAMQDVAREEIERCNIEIEFEGWTDSSTTQWSFCLQTDFTPDDLQQMLWDVGIGYVEAHKYVEEPEDIDDEQGRAHFNRFIAGDR